MDTFLFDFDGTLVDSMPTFVSACFRVLDEIGKEFKEELKGIADYYIDDFKELLDI